MGPTTGCNLLIKKSVDWFTVSTAGCRGRLGGRFEEHAVEPLVELACCPRLEETTKAHAR